MIRCLYTLLLLLLLCAGCVHNPRKTARQQNKKAQVNISKSRFESDNQTEIPEVVLKPIVPKAINTVQIKYSGGVYTVPVEINGIAMEFILDTGASSITISSVEAEFLFKQGKLTEADIMDIAKYSLADGSTGEGVSINLNEVKIGNRVLNDVKAIIMPDQTAPLLFGQSALSKFGSISVDYKRKLLILEN